MNHTNQNHIDSYYAATANQTLDCPSLTENIEVETCIIGGGVTGVSTLLELTEKGQQAVLLEGTKIGFGASGRNGGQVIFGYACSMDVFVDQFGVDKAKYFWDASIEAVNIVEARIAKHNIECDWTKGYATVAIKDRHIDYLKHSQDVARSFGFDGFTVWDQNTTRSHINTPKYIGALYDEASGHLHPLNYCLGLAKAALDIGAPIYEHSPVTKIEVIGDQVHVHTARAKVIAKNLVLAANVYIEDLNDEFLKPLKQKIMPIGTYITATEPLDEEMASRLISPNMAVCDSNNVLNYYRLSADNRLLFGGRINYHGTNQVEITRAIRTKMLTVFPQLENIKSDYTWGGFVDVTANRAPHWGRLAKNIYFAQGFSGHGMALTNLAGRIISEAIMGDDSRLKRFEEIKHQDIPLNKMFRSLALTLGVAYYRFRDAL